MAMKLLNEFEAAKYLAVSVHTLRRWRVTGGGPDFKKIGSRAVRYATADLDDFIVNRQTEVSPASSEIAFSASAAATAISTESPEVEMFEIEKGVPIDSRGRPPSRYLATMRALEIGDSFLMPEGASLSQVYTYQKKLGIKCSSRTIVNGQRRIWRTA